MRTAVNAGADAGVDAAAAVLVDADQSSDQTLAANLGQVWPDLLERLRGRLSGRDQVRAMGVWLHPDKVQALAVEDEVLVLECPTVLYAGQIRSLFAEQLAIVAAEGLGCQVRRVDCRVSRRNLDDHRRQVDRTRGGTAESEEPAPQREATRGRRGGHSFKELSAFVVGSCNRLAYDAVTRILDDPGNPVNPLFIHGSSGLGKTHLEQGLALSFKDRYPKRKVLYLNCEQFRNQYLAACEGGTAGLQAFRVRLRHADLLLVDDIHFLSRGQMERTKDELFSTLNELQEQGKKVVITSDAHPSDIKYLESRFVQRFTGGLVIALDRPDLGTRRGVVLAKTQVHGVQLPDEVVDFIADHITDNMRELEGAVHLVVQYASSFGRSIDLQLARQALSDLIARDASEPRLKVILRGVADYFDISVEDIVGKSRSGPRSTARHIAMYALKSSGSDTYASVGQAFGIKSHSSVAYACEQVARYRATDPDIDRFVADLLLRLRRR